jgi:signal transduction histidine kinase
MPREGRGPSSPSDALPAPGSRRPSDPRDELLSAMSHDLRSPLGSLLVWLELLRGYALDAGPARAAEKIECGVRDLRDMVLRFLDMAQVLSRTINLEWEAADPAASVEAALETVKANAHTKGVRLESVVDGDLPPLRADRRCVLRGLECLVANALLSTPPGGTVEVRVEGAGNRVLFRVRDSGPGLARDAAAALSESLAAGIAPDGSGLRIAVALGVARLHGGALRSASDGEGHGSVFTLELPLAASPTISGGGTR